MHSSGKNSGYLATSDEMSKFFYQNLKEKRAATLLVPNTHPKANSKDEAVPKVHTLINKSSYTKSNFNLSSSLVHNLTCLVGWVAAERSQSFYSSCSQYKLMVYRRCHCSHHGSNPEDPLVVPNFVLVVNDSSTKTPSRVDTSSSNGDGG